MRDKSPILRGELAHYQQDKSLRPPLENGDFSSQILESQSKNPQKILKYKQTALESTFLCVDRHDLLLQVSR
ncbi:hypothetical protein [Helicobacter canis]|uniref:Uncharacterized protein n=1 Tax=Helicobacter canis TaxID=29419 RepID=A0A5M9QIF2_9HELI|nr:hypothetical protein [Helicobacter canis]KAA8707647.1 hypothetical protein F4V45_07160 [Helicobacter canis]